MQDYSPGPWQNNGAIVYANDYGDAVACCQIKLNVVTDTDKENAALIAAAPAMDAILRLIAVGKLWFDYSSVISFEHEGIIRSFNIEDHDWNRVASEIGWERIQTALGDKE